MPENASPPADPDPSTQPQKIATIIQIGLVFDHN
jgi:hypothetical protein